MKKQTKRRRSTSGVVSWALNHISLDATLDHSHDDNYWDNHGGEPELNLNELGKWTEYFKDNATLWVKLHFDF